MPIPSVMPLQSRAAPSLSEVFKPQGSKILDRSIIHPVKMLSERKSPNNAIATRAKAKANELLHPTSDPKNDPNTAYTLRTRRSWPANGLAGALWRCKASTGSLTRLRFAPCTASRNPRTQIQYLQVQRVYKKLPQSLAESIKLVNELSLSNLRRHYFQINFSKSFAIKRQLFDIAGTSLLTDAERVIAERNIKKRSYLEWRQHINQYRNPALTTPAYFKHQYIHYLPTTGRGRLLDAVLQRSSMRLLKQMFGVDSHHYLSELLPHIRESLPEQPRVLDNGCGTGLIVELMRSELLPHAVIDAIDLSPEQLTVANCYVKQDAQLRYHHALAESTPFADNSFDLVTQFYLCHELPKNISEDIFTEVARVLKPGGYLIWADMNQDHEAYQEMAKQPSQRFVEPYLSEYLALDVKSCLERNRFEILIFKQQGVAQYFLARKTS